MQGIFQEVILIFKLCYTTCMTDLGPYPPETSTAVIYTDGVYGPFNVEHTFSNPPILVESVDLSELEHFGILWRMKYLIRMRRLVKIVYEETNNEDWAIIDKKDHRPTVDACLLRFEQSHKRYTTRVARVALAMATKKGFLSTDKSKGSSNLARIIVTGDGLILLTPTGFINELAGTISKISVIGSWIVAIAALIVSILVATRVAR